MPDKGKILIFIVILLDKEQITTLGSICFFVKSGSKLPGGA